MDLLAKSDEEIFAIAKPIWENLVKSSNLKDYGGFTRDFSTQMLFGANEVELGKQFKHGVLARKLSKEWDYLGIIRRGEHVTVLYRVRSTEKEGEWLGRLVLGYEKGEIKIFSASIF